MLTMSPGAPVLLVPLLVRLHAIVSLFHALSNALSKHLFGAKF